MKELIHIACASDNAYVQHTGVMLTSLFQNNTDRVFHIHFFSASFDESNVRTIQKIVTEYKSSFTFYPLDEKIFKDCYISHHISYATYYRIVIPDTIDISVSKLMYMDTDIIINGKLDEMWETNLGEQMLAAVQEPAFNEFERLNLSPANKYFNAGILMINCVAWREQIITEKLFSFIKQYSNELTFWDQDALNAILTKKWIELPPKWNLQTPFFDLPRKKLIDVYGEKELDEALQNPVIIHYTGSSKPWDYINLHPLKKEYFKYLKLTVWKDYQFSGVTPAKRIQKLLMRVLGVKGFQKMVKLFH